MSTQEPQNPPGAKILKLENIDWAALMPSIVHHTPEELEARRVDRSLKPMLALQSQCANRDVFPAVSLSHWVDLAKDAGIAHVPAEVVCSIPVHVILESESQLPEHAVYWEKLAAARAQMGAGDMLRTNACASSDMKFMMQEGGLNTSDEYANSPDSVNPDVKTWRSLAHLGCPRISDIAYSYPGADMAILKRPWVEARREGSHPVEYRVFVDNGSVVGLANYYIQRDIPLDPQVDNEIREALSMAKQLVDHMAHTGSLPFNLGADPLEFDSEKISCTMDFLVAENGDVLFLEAGPAFGAGAHPCAFMKNWDGTGKIQVQGVCLGLGQTPLALEDFAPAPHKGAKP